MRHLQLHSWAAAMSATLTITALLLTTVADAHTSRKHSMATSPPQSHTPGMSAFFPSPATSFPSEQPVAAAPVQGPSSAGFVGMHSNSGGSDAGCRGSLSVTVITVVFIAVFSCLEWIW